MSHMLTPLDYARRHPVAEASVLTFISALSIMQSIISLLFSQADFQADSSISNESYNQHYSNRTKSLRSCAFIMSAGYTGLVLALHREMEHRAADTATQSQWAQDRIALLRRQAHDMATRALEDVARTAALLPSHLHVTHVDSLGMIGWAQFYLNEADEGRVSPAHIALFQRYGFNRFGAD